MSGGQKLALVASLLAVAVIVFDPAGRLTTHYVTQHMEARYTVDGIPLLADISLIEEPDLDVDAVLGENYQG